MSEKGKPKHCSVSSPVLTPTFRSFTIFPSVFPIKTFMARSTRPSSRWGRVARAWFATNEERQDCRRHLRLLDAGGATIGRRPQLVGERGPYNPSRELGPRGKSRTSPGIYFACTATAV